MKDVYEINIKKLQQIGMLQQDTGLCGDIGNGEIFTPEVKSRVPFSKYFNTYEDYLDERNTIEEYIENGIEIPDELCKKLEETAREFGIEV